MKAKNKGWSMKEKLVALGVSIIGIFAPAKELFAVALVLILVDLITGIIAAKKRGEQITSAGFRRTFTKFCIYMTGIGIGFLIEQYMLKGFLPVSNIAAGLISIIEGKSVYENLDKINGSPIFAALIKKLGSVNDIDKAAQSVQEDEKESK